MNLRGRIGGACTVLDEMARSLFNGSIIESMETPGRWRRPVDGDAWSMETPGVDVAIDATDVFPRCCCALSHSLPSDGGQQLLPVRYHAPDMSERCHLLPVRAWLLLSLLAEMTVRIVPSESDTISSSTIGSK
uniref:Uncharacterized protein n=1 Tax=Anopheles coluzzii TaxID=1518534 RepID=A0A8W7PPX9_ANOCL